MLLRRAGLTVYQLATQLGVAQPTISGWVHGRNDPPSRVLREMALILGCGVNDILNGQTPPSRLKAWLERWETESPLAGLVQLRFASGGEYEHPLSERARQELFYGLRSRGRVPWVGFDTVDRRIVFFNARQLESLAMIPAGSAQLRAKTNTALVETASGRHLSLVPNDDLFDVVELLLQVAETPDAVLEAEYMNDWLVRLNSDGDAYSVDYRLGALTLIDVPLEPFVDVVRQAVVERVTRSATGSGNGRRAAAGPAARRAREAETNGSARPKRAR